MTHRKQKGISKSVVLSRCAPRRTMHRNRRYYRRNKPSRTKTSIKTEENTSLKADIINLISSFMRMFIWTFLIFLLLLICILLPFLFSEFSNVDLSPLILLISIAVVLIALLIFAVRYIKSKQVEGRYVKNPDKPLFLRDLMVYPCPVCRCQNLRNANFCQNCGTVVSKILNLKGKKVQTSLPKRVRPLPESVKLVEMAEKLYRENMTCDECGFKYPITLKNCPICQAQRIECMICKRILSYEDDIAHCFYCNTMFHYSHLMEYVKMKGKCPVCRRKLLRSEVVRKHRITNK